MKDLYILLAIIAGVTAWTTFGRALYYSNTHRTNKWIFFSDPLNWCYDDQEEEVEGVYYLIFGFPMWVIEWFCFIVKYVFLFVFCGKFFDIFFKEDEGGKE